MLKRMDVFFTASIFILITAIILVIYTKQREQEFTTHSSDIENTVVLGAAYAINLQLQNKRRHVQLFLDEYSVSMSRILANPNDKTTKENIRKRLIQRFPDFFTYTITGSNGISKLPDIESLVGDVCQKDLQNYSDRLTRQNSELQNKIFIHPQPFNYHYDVMAPLQTTNAGTRIFFTSYYLNEITDILKTHEVPGQNLMLVRQSVPGLIEVTRQGARDQLSRGIHLSEEELNRIHAYENIPGTDWRLVNLPDTNFAEQYVWGLWKEVIIILLIVGAALYLMMLLMARASKAKQ